MRIYLDMVVALNFLVDFLLLLGVNRISGAPMQLGRTGLAAGLGGVYAGGCLMPGFSFLGNWLWRSVSLGLMTVIAFGWNSGALRKGCLFVVLSMALGGIAIGLQRSSFGGLLLSTGGLLLLCIVGFRGQKAAQLLLPVELKLNGKKLRVTALRDTGNTLRDPVTGAPVLILGMRQASALTGLTPEQLRDPVQTMLSGALPGLRLIPYRTVNQSSGMLLCVRCDGVRIGSEPGGRLVALAPEDFPEQQAFQALTGGLYGTVDSVSYGAGTAAAGDSLLHWRKRRIAATPEG